MAKISLSTSSYMDTLLKDIPFESIPACLGGGFASYNEAYTFDLSESGPLFCAGESVVLTSEVVSIEGVSLLPKVPSPVVATAAGTAVVEEDGQSVASAESSVST